MPSEWSTRAFLNILEPSAPELPSVIIYFVGFGFVFRRAGGVGEAPTPPVSAFIAI